MSPEQAEGKKVDARSDIFSLGSVLYEMVTGQKAFQGTSKMSTLSAILHQEPKPVSGISPTIPADLEKLINRCLRKDPQRRWQTMADLKVALDELKEDSDSGRLQAAPAAAKQAWPLWLVVVAVAVVVLLAAGWYWLGLRGSVEPEARLTVVPLTSYPGREDTPSFSPDGSSVAFQWCTEGPSANCDIYIKQIGMEPSVRLTTDPAEDFSPAWSPDGQFVAFLRKLSPSSSALLIVPQRGGPERVLVELGVTLVVDKLLRVAHVAWTPDSKWLVFAWTETDKAGPGLFLLSVETLEKRRLTDGMDGGPAFSPDGRSMAFLRQGPIGSDLYLLHLAKDYSPQGDPDRIELGNPQCFGAAWTPEGAEIVFSSGRWFSAGRSSALWRIAASKPTKSRSVELPADNVSAPAISRQRNRLAYVVEKNDENIWRVDLRSPGQSPGTPVQLISSTQLEAYPDYSPDGKKVAFGSTRSGNQEIWMCDSDGTHSVQLTSFGDARGPRWSPDGKRIVYATWRGNRDVYVTSAKGGAPQRLTTDPAAHKWPRWSRDGQSIYFVSDRSGWSEIWKMPAAGGAAIQITPNGENRDVPQESADGKFLYYFKGDLYATSCSVWRMPVEGGEETKVLDSVHCSAGWTVWQQGIYFFTQVEEGSRNKICYYEFATGTTREVLTVERQVDNHIAVSPDGRTILYTQIDQSGSDLMLVENFR
jgi:Tol biopolymer transport system component